MQLQTRSKLKGTGKEEDHVPSPKREDTRKETEKEMSKGKAPKVPVRQESQLNQSALVSRRGNAKRIPHVTVGTHQIAHITNPKSGSKWGTRV